jgi:hypothetical protein
MARRRGKRAVVLPLLHVLKSVKPEHRVILLAHLDDSSRDALYEAINQVLCSEKIPVRKRLFLKSKLEPYKGHLRYLADAKKGPVGKKKRLAQIGGGPMTHVLREAVPLLLDLFPK